MGPRLHDGNLQSSVRPLVSGGHTEPRPGFYFLFFRVTEETFHFPYVRLTL